MIIGVLPGLGAANGVAILLPVTFTMAPSSAVIFLVAIYYAACFAGSITSILFNIPGEPWSVATTFDGHPMTKKGRLGDMTEKALRQSLIMSHGSFLIFFQRPIAGVCMGVAFFLFLLPLVLKGFRTVSKSVAQRQEMFYLE